MLEIHCAGKPREIGLQHGKGAEKQIKGSLAFYAGMLELYTGRNWESILSIAAQFEPEIRKRWPRLFEEIQGVADGSGQSLLDIVALNVRTEIAFGLLAEGARSDGCTSISWKTQNESYLSQNWDWMEEQKSNLVLVTIAAEGRPMIKMVTEAGIIGKIGLNAAGVGVCLNAVRSRGYDSTRLPVHLGLRIALESSSVAEAITSLESVGMAGSAHILVADQDGAVGLEFTSKTFEKLNMNELGQVLHTNHMIRHHSGIDELAEEDSFQRLAQIGTLVSSNDAKILQPSWTNLRSVLDDHERFPESICRFQQGVSKDATLFSIVMELRQKQALLVVGKQCQAEEEIWLDLSE